MLRQTHSLHAASV